MKDRKQGGILRMAILGGIVVAAILIFGTLWLGRVARRDTETAMRRVSPGL